MSISSPPRHHHHRRGRRTAIAAQQIALPAVAPSCRVQSTCRAASGVPRPRGTAVCPLLLSADTERFICVAAVASPSPHGLDHRHERSCALRAGRPLLVPFAIVVPDLISSPPPPSPLALSTTCHPRSRRIRHWFAVPEPDGCMVGRLLTVLTAGWLWEGSPSRRPPSQPLCGDHEREREITRTWAVRHGDQHGLGGHPAQGQVLQLRDRGRDLRHGRPRLSQTSSE